MTWEHTLLLQFSYYIWWGLFRAPGSIFILVSVPWVLKKMCTLVVLGGVFYICQIGSLYCSVLLYPCWFSNCFINCCERVLTFPTLILDLSIALFVSVCLASHMVQIFCSVRALLELIFILGGLTLSSLCYSPLFLWWFSSVWMLLYDIKITTTVFF